MIDPTIPVLDFRHWFDPDHRERFVADLGAALSDLGFVATINHGIPRELQVRAYELAQAAFALSEEQKKAYEDPQGGRERGYTSFGVEHARDVAAPDLKEFWHVGRRVDGDNPGEVHPNRFPSEVPEFGPTFEALFAETERFAHSMLEAVGAYLGLPDTFFRETVAGGNSVMRVINYPDQAGPVPAGAVRAARHEDINLITCLPASTKPGLELLTRDGEWMAVHTPPDVMVCDTGDMMQLLTAGKLRSTTHRVVNPEESDGGRLSMPFFVHPRRDVLLTPMVEGYAEPVIAHDFLWERLEEIGVTGDAGSAKA